MKRLAYRAEIESARKRHQLAADVSAAMTMRASWLDMCSMRYWRERWMQNANRAAAEALRKVLERTGRA